MSNRKKLTPAERLAARKGEGKFQLLLDESLRGDLESLKAERDKILNPPKAKKRLGSGAEEPDPEPGDTTDVDARIAAAEQDARDDTLTVTFKAISPKVYDRMLARFDDVETDQTQQNEFLDLLTEASVTSVTVGDEPLEFATEHVEDGDGGQVERTLVDQLSDHLSYGEYGQLQMMVRLLNNRMAQSVPFGSKPSATTP